MDEDALQIYHDPKAHRDDLRAVIDSQEIEIARLNLELQKRDKCSFMGPMKDCPTHGESKDAARYRWVLDRMRVTPSGFLELLNNIVPNNACEMLLGERVSVAIDLAIESTRPAG